MEKFPNSLGLHRAPTNLFSTYWGDGHGRDSYITVGNAGLLKPGTYLNRAPQTGYSPKIVACSALYTNQVKPFFGAGKEPTALRYYGDGSGRDSYVV